MSSSSSSAAGQGGSDGSGGGYAIGPGGQEGPAAPGASRVFAATLPERPPGVSSTRFVKVADIQPGTKGVNCLLHVLSCELKVQSFIQKPPGETGVAGGASAGRGGWWLQIAEVVCGDETGVITLRARNAQIEKCIPGRTLVVRNARTEMNMMGQMRLTVAESNWGRLSTAPDGSQTGGTGVELEANDRSGIEYELMDEVSN